MSQKNWPLQQTTHNHDHTASASLAIAYSEQDGLLLEVLKHKIGLIKSVSK